MTRKPTCQTLGLEEIATAEIKQAQSAADIGATSGFCDNELAVTACIVGGQDNK